MKNRPVYAIDSVDHALHLALILQQEGSLRVTEAAERLGVSVSTAHRLLAMLVYRDFAEQRPDRAYAPGSVLRIMAASPAPVPLLRQLALPQLEQLVELVGETATLAVLAQTQVRFIATVECHQVPRAGDRTGRTLPAHLASGGKAILACLDPAAVGPLYAGEPDVDLGLLRRELAGVRRRGYAVNDQRTEPGLTAIGVAVRGARDVPVAAVAIAMPTARFQRARVGSWVTAISAAVTRIEADLAADTLP